MVQESHKQLEATLSELHVYFTCACEHTHTRACTRTHSSREAESWLILAFKTFFSLNRIKNKTSFSPAQNPSIATHYSKPPPMQYRATHVLGPPLNFSPCISAHWPLAAPPACRAPSSGLRTLAHSMVVTSHIFV